jgi:hypothetical protein
LLVEQVIAPLADRFANLGRGQILLQLGLNRPARHNDRNSDRDKY